MDKYTVVYPYNNILLSNKKEIMIDTCGTMNKS